MRPLVKGPIPEWLKANGVTKTSEYKAAAAGSKPSPWRAAEVVAALKDECAKKCMYCEAVIDDVSYSAVEHIRPKSRFEDLVLQWQNLGLACPRCNTNKGDYWSDNLSLRLLNPYEDAIDEHLEFQGPLTVARLSSSRGETTLKKLQLRRDELVLSRMRRIEDIDAKLRLWQGEPDPERKALYAEEVERAIGDDQEHAGVLRAFVARAGFPRQSSESVTDSLSSLSSE